MWMSGFSCAFVEIARNVRGHVCAIDADECEWNGNG